MVQKVWMREFKRPLVITGIVFVVALLIGIAGTTWIFNQKIPESKMVKRVEMLGSGLGLAAGLVVAPFWLLTAARVGKEKRAAQERAKEGAGGEVR